MLGEWYCDTWDRTRDGERTFRVDRIRSAQLLDEVFERRPGVGERDGLGGQPGTAEIWFSRSVARWESERRNDGRTDLVHLTDGSLLATRVSYGSERWLVGEICGYLGDAVLHEPAATRPAVAERARELAAAVRARDVTRSAR